MQAGRARQEEMGRAGQGNPGLDLPTCLALPMYHCLALRV
jgi:hypothetical protein